MPPNRIDSALLNEIFTHIKNGVQTAQEIVPLLTRPADLSTVKRYIKRLIQHNVVTEHPEYWPHRYSVNDVKDAEFETLEYILPGIKEHRSSNTVAHAKRVFESVRADQSVEDWEATYFLLALAVHSQNPKHLSILANKVAAKYYPHFMIYRVFDNMAKRGLDRTMKAKSLFPKPGDMSDHEIETFFVEQYTKFFGQSPQP